VRRLALLLLASLALAACGSSGGKKTPTVSAPSPQTQIKAAYAKFFSGKTSLSQRVALLQNGPKFRAVVQGFANNPLAKNVTATVSSVTLQGANKAKVTYQVKFAGTALPKQTGTAVRENGTWKVGDASLCKLISLQGTTPAACRS
jgi:uncharacterized lipoprotein YbaY